jgi:hypothetical protein
MAYFLLHRSRCEALKEDDGHHHSREEWTEGLQLMVLGLREIGDDYAVFLPARDVRHHLTASASVDPKDHTMHREFHLRSALPSLLLGPWHCLDASRREVHRRGYNLAKDLC